MKGNLNEKDPRAQCYAGEERGTVEILGGKVSFRVVRHRGKFDGKADEGFFVGYSINSKAFRVFNIRKRIVEKNLHIRFSENTPNVVGSGPDWLFDIDALTRTMNYEQLLQVHSLMVLQVQKHVIMQVKLEKRKNLSEITSCYHYRLLIYYFTKIQRVLKMMDFNLQVIMERSTNRVNAVSENISNELPFDPDMPVLEDISTVNLSSDHEDDDEEADMNNMDTTIQVSPVPTTRIHKDHPLDQVIGDLHSTTQTRNMSKNLEEHGIEAIRIFLAYASFNDFLVYQMDVKSDFIYGKIEEEVYVYQPPGFEDPDFPDKVYKVEKALYGLHQAPRAWYETLSTYLLDNGFHRGKIDKTLFIRRHKGDILLVQVYVDDIIFGSTKKELCNAFEKMMHEKFQMSYMGELTFFLGFQTTSKAKTINGEGQLQALVDGKKIHITESTVRRDLQLEDAKGVDCLPNVAIFEQLTLMGIYVAPSHTKKIFRNMRRVGKGFLGRKIPLFPTMMVQTQKEIGEGSANPTDPHHTPTIIQPSTSQPHKKQKPKKSKRKDTQVPQLGVPTESVADKSVNKEMDDSLVRAATTTSSLEAEQDSGNIDKTQSKATPNESSSQGGGPRVESSDDNEDLGEDASKQGRISAINADEDITLVNDQDDEQMFDADQDLHNKEVFVANQDENVVEKEIDAAQVQVSTTATTLTISINEATLAQALAELKYAKPKAKAKGIVFHEPEEPTTTTIPKPKSHDKGEAKMIEEPVKLKKKDQIMLDKEVALKSNGTRSSKRTDTELKQESSKKQKIDNDKETTELKQLVKIMPDEEGVAIDAIPLGVKSLSCK
uniref:Putative ribonuclease H-like domain-containing protein n=1 Tax=Tanacetum cinerariifolium TaxID=118510 RepID=A0A699H8R9_TANCI|nr:putative ribonuclease H-like domain-containing protein [Tanacetum cinerariifolium]